MKLDFLVGKKVLAVKAQARAKGKYLEPAFILFDDQLTILELQEQDYYSYHDCSQSARILELYMDNEKWHRFIKYPDANSHL